MTAEGGELTSPRDESPDWLSNAESSALKSQMHLQPTKLDSEGCVHVYLCTHIHIPHLRMYVASLIEGKEALRLRVWKGMAGV